MDFTGLDKNANFEFRVYDHTFHKCQRKINLVIKKNKKPDFAKNTLLKKLLEQIIIREDGVMSQDDESELSNMMGNLLSFRNAGEMSVLKK